MLQLDPIPDGTRGTFCQRSSISPTVAVEEAAWWEGRGFRASGGLNEGVACDIDVACGQEEAFRDKESAARGA